MERNTMPMKENVDLTRELQTRLDNLNPLKKGPDGIYHPITETREMLESLAREFTTIAARVNAAFAIEDGHNSLAEVVLEEGGLKEEVGLKRDGGKQPWYGLPLEILEPLADVMAAGEKKYGTFNCLSPFEDSSRRFWDANMRHATACQQDPLAIDEETGCYHEACRAFSSLMRIYHAKKERTCK